MASAFRKYPYLNDNGPMYDSLTTWYAEIVTAAERVTARDHGIAAHSENDEVANGMALLYAVELVVDAKENGNVVCQPDSFDIYPEARRNEALRLLGKRPDLIGWGRRCDPA